MTFFIVIFCDQKIGDERHSYCDSQSWTVIYSMNIVEVKFSHSENETFTGNLEYSIVNTSDIFDWNILYSENCNEMDI